MIIKRLLVIALLVAINFKPKAQVNLQTGGATFSLPIFSWQDEKSRLSSIVALSYNSGNGLKVSDIPSNVGQNWDLVFGGVITRLQVGEPDDQVAKEGNEWDITKYPPGRLYANKAPENGCPVALTKYPIYGWQNQIYAQHNIVAEDKQLDYFSFQFNGKAGMFVVDPSNLGNCKLIGDTKVKISFQTDDNLVYQGIRTKITSFTIKDIDGLIYKFTRHGITKILKSEYCDPSATNIYKQPTFKSGFLYDQAGFESSEIMNPYVINSWYLTEIEDALTHRKVYFNYGTSNRNINNIAGVDIIYNKEKDYAIRFHKRSITQTPYITGVTFPDGHTVNFNYGAAREDLKGDYVLSSVDVSYQGRYLSKHEFNTSYFILNRYGTPVTDYQKKAARLCLRSVRKIGVDLKEDTPPYLFDYYTGSSAGDDFVPPPFFYGKDVWGFYNGNNSKGYWNEQIPLDKSITDLSLSHLQGLCFLRTGTTDVQLTSKTGYAKNGLLRQIVYPTGGTLTYNYDQNIAFLNGAYREVGGVHVSQTSATDGGNNNGCANPLTTSYSYINGDGNSSLWGLEMPVNVTSSMTHYQPEYKYYKWTWSCAPFGCCDWKYKYPGIISQTQSIDVQGANKVMETVMGVMTVITTIKDIVTLILTPSPGFWVVANVVIDVISGIVMIAITCIGQQERDRYYTNYYNSDLNAVASLPTQFKRVEVTESSGGTGKTIQEFTSSDDYPIWEPLNPAFSAKQRFAPWAYGLPKRTIVKANNGNIVREVINEYSFQDSTCNYSSRMETGDIPGTEGGDAVPCVPKAKRKLNTTSVKCLVQKSSSQRNIDWADPNHYNVPSAYQTSSNDEMKVDLYDIYTGRVELKSVAERVYKPDGTGQFNETVTQYKYNEWNNYDIKQTIVQESNGDKLYKDIKYNSDFLVPPLSTLFNNNITSLPVSTSTSISKNGTQPLTFLSESVSEYSVLVNGDIKPSRILEQRFSQPVDASSITLYQGPGSSVSQYKETQTFAYDNAGNVIGLKDEGGRQILNIYDYNEKYVSASVINADALTDKAAYTSFETNTYGGWNVYGTVTFNSSQFVTGARALSMSSTTLQTTLSSSKAYTLSFWATSNSSLSIGGGATLTKSSPTINGFTYYEYNVPQGNSSIYIYGNGPIIDEVRIYPASARMRTVSYDPLIGKTSECDENNRITYYEYDNLGRLKFIKDENKNTVKMYEYNNISQEKQNGCPGIYYNKLISEIFTKNNCSQGYIGSNVIYTIPANTFSSALSQEDADALAQASILSNGQNYANANGTCIRIYYNSAQSQNFTKQNCPVGYLGSTVTYTVPANRYSSLVSQAAADQLATDDIAANGQYYANTSPTATCTVDTNPWWESLENAPSYCQAVNGVNHLFVLQTDVNPHSSTQGNTRWWDTGPNDLCPAGTYYSNEQSQAFIRNNCPAGYTGSSVTYTVPPGAYSSTVSLAAANQLALNDIAANGQNYANANGTCTQQVSQCVVTFGNSYTGTGYYYGFTFKFTNRTTGQIYYGSSSSLNNNSTITIPQGAYDITIQQNGGMSNTSYGYSIYSSPYISGRGTGYNIYSYTNVTLGSTLYTSIYN